MNNKIKEKELWKKALDLFPMGVQTASKQPSLFVDGVYPKFIERARGCYIYDIKGNKYIDLMMGLGPIILGYNHQSTNDAIKKQLDKGMIFSLSSPLEVELGELLREVIPNTSNWKYKFAKNGSDVCLASIRVAMSKTNRNHIASNGYHGWSSDYMASLIRPYGINPFLNDFVHEFEFNNLESVEKILKEHECACLIIEPQALTAPKEGFLEGVRKLCDKYGTILIFDDVVCGFRVNIAGSIGHFNVVPDIVLYGKAISNGTPLSVLAGRPEIMNEFENKVFFSGTFGGECLSIASAIATINELKIKDYNHIWDLGNQFKNGLLEMSQGIGLDGFMVQGSAPRMCVKFDENKYEDAVGMKDLFFQEMCKSGVFMSNVIYHTFAHTKKDVDFIINASRNAFKVVKENMGDIDKALEGKRSSVGIRKNS